MSLTVDGATPGGQPSPQGDSKQASQRAIQELSELGDNWDGNGSAAVNEQSVMAAKQFVTRNFSPNTPAAQAGPTPDGGVQIEWHTRGLDLEIEFSPDGKDLGFLFAESTSDDAIDVAENGLRADEPRILGALKALSDAR